MFLIEWYLLLEKIKLSIVSKRSYLYKEDKEISLFEFLSFIDFYFEK